VPPDVVARRPKCTRQHLRALTRLRRLFRALAGSLSFALVLVWLGLVALPSLSLGVAPAARWWPERRLRFLSVWARLVCRVTLGLLRLGGARYTRQGMVDTSGPGIVVTNHQSVLDIPTLVLMSRPWVPAFIARGRYARPGIPILPLGLRLAECPVIDPDDRAAASAILRQAVRRDRTLLIYPEGHRSDDGELQRFRPAGLVAMLEERRVPVWLVATDGFSAGRCLADFVMNVHRIDGCTELVGRYDPPSRAEELPAFVAGLHADLKAHLVIMRERRSRGQSDVVGVGGVPAVVANPNAAA
jgi:1-acyl-sn-glycerol-3-phosphate acyltransferase